MKIILVLSSLFLLGACSPEAARAFQEAAQNVSAMERANQASMMPPPPMHTPKTVRCQTFGNGMVTCREF